MPEFLALAFGLAWLAWGLALLLPPGPGDQTLRVIGTFGPSVAAVVLLGRRGGRGAVSRSLGRLVRLRGHVGATVLAAGVPPVLAGVGIIADRLLGGGRTVVWPPWWVLPVVIAYVAVLGGPLGEELGWRGYLLPVLEDWIGAARATLVLGGVWALWHLPLFFLDGAVQTFIPWWIFVWQIMVTSVFYTYLVHRAPESLAPVLAFHTSFNVSVGILLLQPPDAPAIRPLVLALIGTTTTAALLVARVRHVGLGGSTARATRAPDRADRRRGDRA